MSEPADRTEEQGSTVKQAAERLGLSVPSIYRLVREGLIEAERVGKRGVRFTEEALAALQKVAEDLGLEYGDGLGAKKFDEVSRRLELGWSSAKIRRSLPSSACCIFTCALSYLVPSRSGT